MLRGDRRPRERLISARLIRIRGVVQGVGFRPFTYRLAGRFGIAGWVKNDADGVEIFAERTPRANAGGGATGAAPAADPLDLFVRALESEAPSAARIASCEVRSVPCEGFASFEIRHSSGAAQPTVRIAPDLAVCDACVGELFDPADRRYRYPYINCTNCGPRYSIVRSLPYDRPATTMAPWPMCAFCAAEYGDPTNRRFHAQPVACPECGPTYVFRETAAGDDGRDRAGNGPRGYEAIVSAAAWLRAGRIVAIKGIGGYHLACDARDERAVTALRERKFRKERPFAVMAADAATAQTLADGGAVFESELRSTARPIVLAHARARLSGVAPDNSELGLMLPYAPLHHLLFAGGAPEVLVLTSANRSSEPIAYDDAEAWRNLAGVADAFLIGERPIARRLDDSIVRVVVHGNAGLAGERATASPAAVMLRRGRGYAPMAVATLPVSKPILAVGGDLKNALVLVVAGQAFASQHIGDLEQHSAREACEATIADLCAMYDVTRNDLLVVCDRHPQYVSTAIAHELGAATLAVQHHRAHVASVLAERGELDANVVGIAFDGTGYGDDGSIWGGEFFTGSAARGFERRAHLRTARLPGGDAAARFPTVAAVGFLAEVDGLPDLMQPPFCFDERYANARKLLARDVRCFPTTSAGRLFDTVAALLGFTRAMTFEGQAAMWLEHLARSSSPAVDRTSYRFTCSGGELDYRPLLETIAADRCAARSCAQIAYAFHVAVAEALVEVADALGARLPVVCSGGVFQNVLLVDLLRERMGARLWTNAKVPPNDGGLALGQAALAVAHLSAMSDAKSRPER